jgi:hypothetical protein
MRGCDSALERGYGGYAGVGIWQTHQTTPVGIDYARFAIPAGTELVFFVIDVNGALSLQTKGYLEEFQAVLKSKGHSNFVKYLLRNLLAVLAYHRASAVRHYDECASRERVRR